MTRLTMYKKSTYIHMHMVYMYISLQCMCMYDALST